MKLLLIGDSCLDQYYYGSVDRLNPEAPVPIFNYKSKEVKYGMSYNVCKNLKKLGVDVTPYYSQPSIKTRYIDKKTNYQVLRVDVDNTFDIGFDPDKIDCSSYDAIIVADYDKGFITEETIFKLNKLPKRVFVDTKKRNLSIFGDNCILKINETEYNNRSSDHPNIIITLGEKGARFKNRIVKGKKIEVFDVCGAGDTFLAAFAYKSIMSNDYYDAIEFANKAASITVQHLGVYAPTLEEINNA